MNAIKEATGVLLNIDDGLYIIDDILQNENPVMLAELLRDVLQYGKTRVEPIMPRERQQYFRMLKRTIDGGMRSMDEKVIAAKYGGYKTKTQRANTKEKKPENDGLLSMAEWWAEQDEYTPELFKNTSWYDEAAAIYESQGKARQAKAGKYNTNPNHNTNPNNNLNENETGKGRVTEDKGNAGGQETIGRGEPTNEQSDVYSEIMKMVKDSKAVDLVRNNELLPLANIMKHYAIPRSAADEFRENTDLQQEDEKIEVALAEFIYERRLTE